MVLCCTDLEITIEECTTPMLCRGASYSEECGEGGCGPCGGQTAAVVKAKRVNFTTSEADR